MELSLAGTVGTKLGTPTHSANATIAPTLEIRDRQVEDLHHGDLALP